MNYFFIHRDQIYEQGLSIGFKTFSVGHLLWLLAIAAFCWLTGLFGISTKYAEGLLAVKYRVKTKDGRLLGGPM